MISDEEILRYSRQIKLQEIGLEGQKKLKDARVFCVGAGGLGSPLLLYLTAAGVGTIGIAENDNIDETNLHRQVLFQTSSVGKPKVFEAKERLQNLNPLIQIYSYDLKFTLNNCEKLISSYDLIADCSDNFETRYLIHDTCLKLNKPYFYASAQGFSGHCSLFFGKENPCLRCLFPSYPKRNIYTDCDSLGVLGPTPGILGLIQATEIMKWTVSVGRSLHNFLLTIDLLNMNFKKIQLCRNPECIHVI
jgi:adenylyltransferase/sulfurtransferase